MREICEGLEDEKVRGNDIITTSKIKEMLRIECVLFPSDSSET